MALLLAIAMHNQTSELTPSPELGSVPEQHVGDERQGSGNQSQDQTGILRADVVEELGGEQGGHGTQGVTHETLTGDSRGRALTVAIGGEAVAGLEDEEDTDGDEDQGNDGSDPGEIGVLGEGVDEETDGEPDGTVKGTVETSLGVSLANLNKGFVLADLEEVETEAHGGSQAECDVGKTGDTLVPALLFLEGDGDDAKEEEGQEPGEGDPETEGEDDGFGGQHLDGLDGGVVKHGLEGGGFQVVLGHVAVITGVGAEGLGALAESDATTGFREEEEDDEAEGNVGETLDTLNPTPAQSLIDEAGVDGGTDGTEDGDEREGCNGDGAVLGAVHVTEGTTDKDGTDTTEQTEQGTADEDGADVLAQGETDEHNGEAEVGAGVDDTAASQLTEGGQEERSQGTGEVEEEETEFGNFGRGAQVGGHVADTGAVGCCGETDEEGHETEKAADESLVLWVPVEGVLLVSRDEVEDDVLVTVLDHALGDGDGEVEVNGLEGAIMGRALVDTLEVFPTGHAT